MRREWSKPQITEIKVKMTEMPANDHPPGNANGKISTGNDAFGLGHS